MDSLCTVPECKRGHGPMSVVTNGDGSPTTYGAIASPALDSRFAFVAFRCAVCSCVEFHDCSLPFESARSPARERRVSQHPVNLERRAVRWHYARA